MSHVMRYRSYKIRFDGENYTACPDEDSDLPTKITATSLSKIQEHVDALWSALEDPTKETPSWIRWLITGPILARISPDITDLCLAA